MMYWLLLGATVFFIWTKAAQPKEGPDSEPPDGEDELDQQDPEPEYYEVQPGDTLSVIAARYNLTLARLLAKNPMITDPNIIHPGDRVRIN